MTLALDHLRIRLGPVLRALGNARHLQVDASRAALERVRVTGEIAGASATLTDNERRAEVELRALGPLPLDAIVAATALDEFEQSALLLCTAIQIDPQYGALIASLQSGRREPTVGIVARLFAMSFVEQVAFRRALDRCGKLRRYGLLRAVRAKQAVDDELELGPNVLDALLGITTIAPRDPLERADAAPLPACVDHAHVAKLADAIRAGAVAGVWGPRRADHEAVALALAAALGTRARVVAPFGDLDPAPAITDAAADAAALGQLLWIDCDLLHRHAGALDALAYVPTWVCLTGEQPLRPVPLLSARAYAEIELVAPSAAERLAAWQRLPHVDEARAGDLAVRYRFGRAELSAIARMAETAIALGSEPGVAIEAAAGKLVHPHSRSFARVIRPQRTARDLVLKPELHGRVLGVARMYRSWPYVREHWGFAYNGCKALFAGESGTGKTLAAEVIAHELGLPLVTIDLSQVVSKWIGETEKNLDTVFREADDGDAVLFLDEADALLGKRGEVQRGTDRYANLEVSFLLQRFEVHDGLVILSTNLQGQMDKAFMRRFQVIAQFHRPEPAERLRLWQLAFPEQAPLAEDIDLPSFASIDLTGAGIFAVAREAALHAADAGAPRISVADLVHGVFEQFRREARSFPSRELKRYAAHFPPGARYGT